MGYPQIHVLPPISLPLFILCFCEYVQIMEQHFEQWRSPISSHAYSSMCARKHTHLHSHPVKGSLALGQGISATDWS